VLSCQKLTNSIQKIFNDARFQASAAKQMKTALFWANEVLTIEDGTDRLSRNVGKKLPLHAAAQKGAVLV